MNSEVNQMIQAVVQAADPEQIVLFGSRAKGAATPSSDYDFALVFESADRLKTGLRRANRALWPRRYPVDLVGLTTKSLRQGSSVLAREISASGRVLYGRTPVHPQES